MSVRAPRAGLGRTSTAINGIVPGSTDHLVLLAIRGCGGMTSEQISNRFGYVSASLYRLKKAGLIDVPAPGQKGIPTRITEAGRLLTEADGPLCRRKNLITYCQL